MRVVFEVQALPQEEGEIANSGSCMSPTSKLPTDNIGCD
jgi:hypothetical protein